MANHTATVETLTAEVRVLMVGSRQVTLSVARQLDIEAPGLMEPFGRIRTDAKAGKYDLEVIGRHAMNGSLCRSEILVRERMCGYAYGVKKNCPDRNRHDAHRWDEYLSGAGGNYDGSPAWERIYLDWQALPLIVLAGLR